MHYIQFHIWVSLYSSNHKQGLFKKKKYSNVLLCLLILYSVSVVRI